MEDSIKCFHYSSDFITVCKLYTVIIMVLWYLFCFLPVFLNNILIVYHCFVNIFTENLFSRSLLSMLSLHFEYLISILNKV